MPLVLAETLVFDFDGTLCDSYETALQAFNSLASEYHYEPVPQNRFAALRDLNSKELVGSFGIPPSLFPEVMKKVIQRLHVQIASLRAFPGIAKVLRDLQSQGHQVGVLTSNSEKNVREFAALNQLKFNFIYSDGQLFGKHELLVQMIRELKLSLDQVIYVGDETRDIEAARQAGIKVVAVNWGFNSEKILKTYHPDWLIHSPSELSQLTLKNTVNVK